MPVRSSHDGRGLVLAAVTVLVALVAGCSAPADPAPARPPSPEPPAALSTGPVAAPALAPAAVDIPRIGARSSLVPLGLNPDETIEVPPVSQPMQAGWYRLGPAPGELGPAVILGHVDGGGRPGIFHRLRELQPGDEIIVTRDDGSAVTFVARSVERIPKAEFPTEKVYGDTTQPELRLITCGGSFDRQRGSYRDNVIVYAVLKT